MEHTTFAKKTVVLAALGALSLMAATARADGTETPSDPQPKNIEVTVGSGGVLGIASEIKNDETSVTWDNEWLEQKGVLGENWSFGGLKVQGKDGSNTTITVTSDGSLTIDLPTKEATEVGNDEKVVTFDSVNLSVKDGGTFKNSSHLKFTGGSFKVSVESADSVANFENTGEIYLQSSSMEVGSGSTPFTSSDEKLALNVGDVTIGSGAMLTNKDKGYQVTKEADGESRGEGAEPGEDQTLVHFGTVTVAVGGNFVNASGALSEGETLVLQAEKTAQIDGESVWETLRISAVNGKKSVSNYVTGVDGNDRGDFRVTGALQIGEFASDNDIFTIDGSNTATDAEVFADGIDISAGSHVAADDLQQPSDDGGFTWGSKPHVGTLAITGYAATFTPANASEEDGETETQDDDTNGSWSYKKFGDVTVVNTKLDIHQVRPEGTDPYDGHGYTPSLEMSSLNLVGTSMKIAYDVDVERIKDVIEKKWTGDEPIDMDGWTKDNILDELEALLEEDEYAGLKTALEGHRDTFETGLADVLTKKELSVESEISGSDLAIGTLSIARENTTVKVEEPFLSEKDEGDSGEGTATTANDSAEEGTTTEPETVTITGNDVYDLGDLTLKVTEGSNLDVGTLDLQTGEITLDNSKMMVSNVKTLNGSLTLKSGYLGLNVTSSVAKLMKSENEAETKADPDSAPATLEVGSPVTIGESGKLTVGGDAIKHTTTDGTEVDYAIGIAGSTNLVFDGRNFGSEALFSQTRSDGGKGLVVVKEGESATLNVKASNLSWGVYKLFDEDTLDTSALDDVTIVTDKSSASDLWEGATVKPDEGNQNQIVVGNKTIEGSGLEDIGAVNLMNSVFGGDRGSALDKRLVDAVLSNATSLEEISNTINSVTGLGAVAGLTAMAVDFGNYVADQVEHHAVTMPRQAEGWWVQPIAGKLKSDDLAVGGMKSGYSIDTFGIMGGFDRKLRNGDTIGVAASYQSGDADSEGSALPVSTDVTNYGFHLWHARELDAFRLMGMFSYSKTSGDAKMNVLGQEVTSDLGATEISIGARADKEFKWGTVRMIPHAGVRASMIDVDDYTVEMGSDELFKVSEDKLWIFEVPVGVTFASSFEYARWNVQPYVDLTVRGRFGDTDSTFTLEGSNTSDSMKYDVTGDVIGDLRIGYMSTFQDLNLGMSYGLSAGDGGRQNHQIEATLRIDFN